MSASPSILFTNLLLGGRTGSELHVLELAQSFSTVGWDVTCYALVVAYPLQLEFNKAGVKLVEYGNEDQLEQKYDVLFTQHHVVSDYLLSNHDIAFRYLIASVLGANIPHDFPSCHNLYTLGSAISLSNSTSIPLFSFTKLIVS